MEAETFIEWIRHQACLRCGVSRPGPHHVKSRGSGGQDEANLVPLCRVCHTVLHQVGRKTFEDRIGYTLENIAGIYWHLYQEDTNAE